jgi:hypothetical protein
MYQELKAWKEQHLSAHVPRHCFDAPQLGAWVRHMRKQYKEQRLEQWKVERCAGSYHCTRLGLMQAQLLLWATVCWSFFVVWAHAVLAVGTWGSQRCAYAASCKVRRKGSRRSSSARQRQTGCTRAAA